jgi:D-alanyl-D-alanine carboxypeptidase
MDGASLAFEPAARRNADSLRLMPLDLFGRAETGWAIYAPTIAVQVGAQCGPDTPAFAAAIARWSTARGLAGDGVVTPELLALLKADWQASRPFMALRGQDMCPEPPGDAALVPVPPELSDTDKPVLIRPGALAAWARLVRDARAQEPALAANPELLRIFSAFRSPAYDEARCARENNCQGLVRASCSVHRTGLALDVMLDFAPGFGPDSSADQNRLVMTQGVAYRWLVANARRYGFVNYAFEPWHWEWTGEPP